MDFNFITHIKTCSDFIAYSNPMTMIFYSHIPVALAVLLVGIFVLIKNKNLVSKILFAISVSFFFWTLIDLIVWTSSNSIFTIFSWSFFGLFTGLVSISSFYFFYVFILKKDLNLIKKILVFLPLTPIIFITPTTLNLLNFKIISCEATENLFYDYYYYGLGFMAILGILLIFTFNFKKIEKTFRQQATLMCIGLTLFLLTFLSMSYISSYFDNYNFEFYGLFGMIIFMSLLAYLIVKFKAFEIKLLGAQALVWSLIILIGSQFFFIQNNTNKILTAITLVLSSVVGFMIVSSVKKEDILNEELGVANAGQKNLIHLMNHQIKGYLSISKNIFAELLTDDYGKMPEEARDIVEKGLESSDKGQKYVSDILRGASAESGSLMYDMQSMDFKTLILKEIENQKKKIEKKNLTLDVDISDGDYNMIGDCNQLGEAMRNLIENSIYYTPTGGLSVSLKRKDGKILFSMKDTGVGVRPEDKNKLFKAGSVAVDSIKININSSGYGLVFVKGVIEKHKGKVWFESEGESQGTTFFVELPVK